MKINALSTFHYKDDLFTIRRTVLETKCNSCHYYDVVFANIMGQETVVRSTGSGNANFVITEEQHKEDLKHTLEFYRGSSECKALIEFIGGKK